MCRRGTFRFEERGLASLRRLRLAISSLSLHPIITTLAKTTVGVHLTVGPPSANHHCLKEIYMGLILLIVVVLLLIGGLPTWGYSRKWGYGPSGGLGLILVIILILVLLGYIPRGF